MVNGFNTVVAVNVSLDASLAIADIRLIKPEMQHMVFGITWFFNDPRIAHGGIAALILDVEIANSRMVIEVIHPVISHRNRLIHADDIAVSIPADNS